MIYSVIILLKSKVNPITVCDKYTQTTVYRHGVVTDLQIFPRRNVLRSWTKDCHV
jgi:hypothetical protein